MDTTRIAGYVLQDKLHRTVPGWLSEGAISAVIAFAGWQQRLIPLRPGRQNVVGAGADPC